MKMTKKNGSWALIDELCFAFLPDIDEHFSCPLGMEQLLQLFATEDGDMVVNITFLQLQIKL